MKKNLLWTAILTCSLFCLSGCSDDDTPAAEAQTRVEVSLQDDLYLNDEGDAQTFTITTNKAWSLQGADGLKWLSVEPSAGGAGENTIAIKATVNDTYSPREAQLTLRCGTEEKVLKFIQVQNDALILSAPTVEMTSDGGKFDVVVKANIDFTIEIPEDSKDWIVQQENAPSSRALQSQSLTFKVDEYTGTGEDREGHIIIRAANEDKSQTILVNQKLLSGQLPNLVVNEGKTLAEAFAAATNEPDTVTMLNIVGRVDSLDLVYVKSALRDQLVSLRLNRAEMPVSEESDMVRFPQEALQKFTKLKEFTFPRNIQVIGASALEGNTSLSNELVIPETVVAICDRALLDTKFRGELKLPVGLQFIGSSAFSGNEFLKGSLKIPAGIKNISASAFKQCTSLSGRLVIPETVETISTSAFAGCKGLSDELVLPATLKDVETAAFLNCSGITDVRINWQPTELPKQLFSGCSSLSGVVDLPATITRIGDSAFSGCSMLTGVNFPTGLTIGASAFNGCTSLLGTLTLPAGLVELGADAYKGCNGLTAIVFPSTLTSIGGFAGCTGLEEVALPDGVDELQSNAFSGCSNLKKINLPNTLKTIGSGAFNNCSSLEGKIEIPVGVTSIEANTFTNCASITSVRFPSTLTVINIYAFQKCSKLSEIIFEEPASITEIGSYAFQGTALTSFVYPESVEKIGMYTLGLSLVTSVTFPSSMTVYPASGLYGCGALTEFTIPNQVTAIGTSFFNGCSKLETVTVSEAIEELPMTTFSGCSSLKTITFEGEKIATIGSQCFMNCTSLKSLTLPKSVTSLGSMLFYGANAFQSLTVLAETPPAISMMTFMMANPNMTVYVPTTSVDAYKAAAYWKDLNIQPIN